MGITMARLDNYLRNIALMAGQSAIQRIMGLLTTMVLARVLGASSLGAYSVVINTASSAFQLAKFGIDGSVHVVAAEAHSDLEARLRKGETLVAGFVLLSLAGGVGAVSCVFLAEWIAVRVFGQPSLEVWVRIAGLMVVLQAISQFCYVTMAGLQRFQKYGRIMIVSATINMVAVAGAALSAGLFGAVVAMVSVQVVSTLWLLRSTRIAIDDESLALSMRNFAERAAGLIKLGLPFYAAAVIAVPIGYYLQGMLSISGGLEALGYLRAIATLGAIVTFLPASASGPMISMLARTRTESAGALPERIMRSIKMVFVLALFITGGITLLLPWLMPALFGGEYAAAVGPTGISLISASFTAVGAVIGNALFSSRRVDLVFLATIVHIGIFCAAGVLLIPRYGLTGYVVAELLGSSSLLLAAWWCSSPWFRRHSVRLTWMWKALVPVTLLVAYAASQAARNGQPDATAAIVGAALFAVACVWTYRTVLDDAERYALRRFVGRA